LGAEFFRWEYATAVACFSMGVNAIDQPKFRIVNRTKQAIQHYLEKGSLNEGEANFDDGKIRIYTPLKLINKEKLTYPLKDAISQFISLKNQGDYLAINAFLPRNEYVNNLLQKFKKFSSTYVLLANHAMVMDRVFLHSTGHVA
jgi:ABC-type proline/glycine betaine transport system substrate-binding protein